MAQYEAPPAGGFRQKWLQPPHDKYDRCRHCVNKFEIHPPNDSNM